MIVIVISVSATRAQVGHILTPGCSVSLLRQSIQKILGAGGQPRAPRNSDLPSALALVVIHRRIVDKHTCDLASIDDCLDAPINRRLNVGVGGLACQDHALGQVAGSDVEYVDVVNGHDLLQAVYGDDILEENGNQRFVVGLVNVVLHAVTLTTASRAAMPDGAVLEASTTARASSMPHAAP